MTKVNLTSILNHAAAHDYAVPAFNVCSLEQCWAVLHAARAENAPAILQFTAPTISYFGPSTLSAILEGLNRTFSEVPICTHLDHGFDEQTCTMAMDVGFTSVMIDASVVPDFSRPTSLVENIATTASVVAIARRRGVSVEGAIGVVGSVGSCLGPGSRDLSASINASRVDLTDPTEAADFARATGIDALAIAIGTTHGLHKFAAPPADDDLKIDKAQALHELAPKLHLVLHGASLLPEKLLARLRDSGGSAPTKWGITETQLQRAVQAGVRKINVATDVNLAMTAGLRESLATAPEEVDPRVYLAAGMRAMTDVCRQRFKLLGASGRSNGIASPAPAS